MTTNTKLWPLTATGTAEDTDAPDSFGIEPLSVARSMLPFRAMPAPRSSAGELKS